MSRSILQLRVASHHTYVQSTPVRHMCVPSGASFPLGTVLSGTSHRLPLCILSDCEVSARIATVEAKSKALTARGNGPAKWFLSPPRHLCLALYVYPFHQARSEL